MCFSYGAFYIGLSDQDMEGTFVWKDSFNEYALTWDNWLTAEPNGGTSENCVEVYTAPAQPTWVDISCTLPRQFMCQVGGYL